MEKIKFSHNYPKLHGQIAAQLLKVEVHDRKELNEDFVGYDTYFYVSTNNAEYAKSYYQLPPGKLIVLVFLGDKLIPFTTVRPWTPTINKDGLNKEQWYRSHIGKLFEIIFTKEEI